MEMDRKRYTVLTYIFGGYEQVHEVLEKDPEAEYVLVTDDAGLNSDTWRVIHDPMPHLSVFGKCYEVRFHPFRYASTPVVVRVDGSIEIRKPLKEVVDAFETGNYDRCFMIHPHRNLLVDEYEVWIRTRGYSRVQAVRCLSLMTRMGYDLNKRGLVQGCFEVLRDNAENKALNDLTFGLLTALAKDGRIERLDQTITSFVLQRFFPTLNVMAVEEDLITDGQMMQWCLHGTRTPIAQKDDKIEAVLFDREIPVWRLPRMNARARGGR